MTRFGFESLLCMLICGSAAAQTVVEVQTALDSRNYQLAKVQAEALFEQASDPQKAQAATLLLRSLNLAGDHEALELKFQECVNAAARTIHESSCYLERAKSTEGNLKDKPLARRLYDDIVQQYPKENVVAAEALYQRAGLELDAAQPEQAVLSYYSLADDQGDTSFADKAYAGLAKSEAALMNPQGIRDAVYALETKFPSSPSFLHAIRIQADFANAESGNIVEAIRAYLKLIEINPKSQGASTARLRLADMIYPENRFEDAIAEYHSIMVDFPEMTPNARAWAWCQIGMYNYQLERLEEAQAAFETVHQIVEANHGRAVLANQYLKALDNPDSIEGLLCLYDKGVRWRQTGFRERCWDVFQEFVRKADEGTVFKAYVSDTSVPIGERAQMLYRKSFALFEAVDHVRSIEAGENVVALLAESKIADQDKPYLEWVTAQEAEFFEAYHHIHHGHYSHSAMILRKIIDNPRRHKELVPKCYKELVLCYQHEDDTLGAALAAEEFLILYPYRVEAEHFRSKKARLLGDHPEVSTFFKEKREVLLARYGKEPQDLKTALKDVAESTKTKIVVSAENGGGQ